MQRRHFSLALLAATSQLAAHAATEGREYTRLQQPVPVAVPGKVEVMEFFGYCVPRTAARWNPNSTPGCTSCRPTSTSAACRMAFEATPTKHCRKLYFAIESLGLVDTLHRKVFTAIHGQRQSLRTEAEVADWAKAAGADVPKLLDAMKSFSVATKLRQARVAAEAVLPGQRAHAGGAGALRHLHRRGGHGHPQLLAVLDELIAKSRKGG